MSDIVPLIPRQKAPALNVSLVGGGSWSLAESRPGNFTMIVFYRGMHCPICKTYLGSLQKLLPKFAERGVEVIALSSDTRERAERSKTEWDLPELSLGYGLGLRTARAWGLYISAGRGKTSIGIEEPALFSEPGIFFVRPDGELFHVSTQSMPFARPDLAGFIGALDFVLKANYPARGEVELLSAAE